MNTNDIEQNISQLIVEASLRLTDNRIHSNAAWTDAIFLALTNFAYKLNPPLWVWTKKNAADTTLNGFLYDFTIREGANTEDRNKIDKVWVAMEIEWKSGWDEIRYDFYKLILGRSMLRVMIFQSRHVEQTISDLVEVLETNSMSICGDRYLFAGWSDKKNGFTFKSHTKG